MNSLGDILDLKNDNITAILPGGSTDKNISVLKRGATIDFSGNVSGAVLPNGEVIDVNNVVSGRALSDGNIVNRNGRLNG